MGSKRDGVTVPWDKHGVRVAPRVRAAEHAGTLPGMREEAPHKRKGGGPKPWKIQCTFEWLNHDKVVVIVGRYATKARRDFALKAFQYRAKKYDTYVAIDPVE